MADEHDWRDERPDEDPVAGNGERPETPAAVPGDVGEDAGVAEAAHLLSAEAGERGRGPRAQSFRRRLRDQGSTLPLAAWLVALGAFLLARERGVDGLPELTDLALVEVSVLAVATTLIMHSVLSGRRERGLLFFGLWIWVTAGMIAALVYGIDDQPEVGQWWPLILWSLALTLLLTYLLERTHDARLVP